MDATATLVNLTVRLQSGATTSLFSYSDYEGYRDAAAASWIPSRRAMRIDPLVALRDQ